MEQVLMYKGFAENSVISTEKLEEVSCTLHTML